MAGYCTVEDLLTGEIPTPAYIDKSSYIQLAADEINIVLGQRYVVPVAVPIGPEFEPSRLILKQINIFIATGRLIMAAAAGGSDTDIHAYGFSLLKQGQTMLMKISSGEVGLLGATPSAGGPSETSGIPLVSGDAVSSVDSFYSMLVPGGFNING